MKNLLALIAVFAFSVACSSPREKYAKKEVRAQEQYQESMKEAQDDYKEENNEQQKEEASDMIDEGHKFQTDSQRGHIQVDD